MKIIIAGGTGFVGQALVTSLVSQNHQVIVLSRSARPSSDCAYAVCSWDGQSLGDWAKHVDSADAIINLSGEGVAKKRWSESQKKRIFDSRINSTQVIGQAIAQAKQKPSVWINASAVGYYGFDQVDPIDESAPNGEGFLSKVCVAWEREAWCASDMNVRVVLLRIGVVLEKEGGALKRMLTPFAMGLGGPLGSGRQWFPWIHRDDLVSIIEFALSQQDLSGPVNAVAPNPVTMKTFCNTLGEVLNKPSWLPAPGFALKLLLGEMSELMLGGQNVHPKKLNSSGYEFKYDKLGESLRSILQKES